MLNWEQVELGWFNTWRAEVPGGWLVFAVSYVSIFVGSDVAMRQPEQYISGLTFFPDPQHQWKP